MSAAPAPVRIRAARPYDAAALLELKHQLDRETAFMMYEPGERDSPVRDLAAELAGLARSANSVVLLAELGDQLIGYVQLTGGSLRRSRATAYVVIGVLARAAGRGTGTELLRQAKAWATARGLHRLELTVMAHNTRAIRLYERMGFSVEGRRSECLLVDGQFIDELTMATLLPAPPATPLSPAPPPPLSPASPGAGGACLPGDGCDVLHLLLCTLSQPRPVRAARRAPVLLPAGRQGAGARECREYTASILSPRARPPNSPMGSGYCPSCVPAGL